MLLVDAAPFDRPPPARRGDAGSTALPSSLRPSLRPRRGPRAEEIALMRSLAAGPRSVTEGPIGRCVKRDWCRAVVKETGAGAARTSTVIFTLTEVGRALIG